MTGDEVLNAVSVAVKAKMADEKLTLRVIADQTGVAASTIHRLSYGANVSLANLLTLARWAGLDVWIGPA